MFQKYRQHFPEILEKQSIKGSEVHQNFERRNFNIVQQISQRDKINLNNS